MRRASASSPRTKAAATCSRTSRNPGQRLQVAAGEPEGLVRSDQGPEGSAGFEDHPAVKRTRSAHPPEPHEKCTLGCAFFYARAARRSRDRASEKPLTDESPPRRRFRDRALLRRVAAVGGMVRRRAVVCPKWLQKKAVFVLLIC